MILSGTCATVHRLGPESQAHAATNEVLDHRRPYIVAAQTPVTDEGIGP